MVQMAVVAVLFGIIRAPIPEADKTLTFQDYTHWGLQTAATAITLATAGTGLWALIQPNQDRLPGCHDRYQAARDMLGNDKEHKGK